MVCKVCNVLYHGVFHTTSTTLVNVPLLCRSHKLLGGMIPNENLQLVPNSDAFAGVKLH